MTSPGPAGAWDRWGRSVAQGALVLFIGFNVVTWLGSRGGLPVGTTGPVVRLPRLSGGEGAVGEPTGSPVVLEFWATWCAACRRALPEVQAVAEGYRGGPVRFLLVDLDEASPERDGEVRAALGGLGVDLPVALDDGRAARANRVERQPHTVVLDGKGRIAGTWTGEWDETAVTRLLEGSKARTSP